VSKKEGDRKETGDESIVEKKRERKKINKRRK